MYLESTLHRTVEVCEVFRLSRCSVVPNDTNTNYTHSYISVFHISSPLIPLSVALITESFRRLDHPS